MYDNIHLDYINFQMIMVINKAFGLDERASQVNLRFYRAYRGG